VAAVGGFVELFSVAVAIDPSVGVDLSRVGHGFVPR
jgi:hypothetical protein